MMHAVLQRMLAVLAVGGVVACGASAPRNPSAADGGAVVINPPTPGGGEELPPIPPDARCAPSGAETYWITEGALEEVTGQVSCRTGLVSPALRFALAEPPPSWLVLDEATGALRLSPAMAQDGVWELAVRETTTGESGILKVGVAVKIERLPIPGTDRFDNRATRIDDPARYTEEYGLPVFHLSSAQTDGSYRPATITYRGAKSAIELKYRGATSAIFDKRSFTLKFPEESPFNEPGFGGEFKNARKVVLITTFNDNSYVRSRLAFDLWNKMSPEEHIRIRTFSAVVYHNGRYLGVYTAADNVDDRLVRLHGLSKDGTLFKGQYNDANFSRYTAAGALKTDLFQGFEIDDGTYDPQPVRDLTAFVADNTGAPFLEGFRTRLRSSEYEDWWIFNTLILGTDSAGKNSYHYFDPATNGPWRFIPWDLDASFGQDFDTTRTAATTRDTFASKNKLFERMLAEPAIQGPMRARYRELLDNKLSVDVVLGLINKYERENGAAARRDWAIWAARYKTFGATGDEQNSFSKWATREDINEYDQELEYVRNWIRTRWTTFLGEGLP